MRKTALVMLALLLVAGTGTAMAVAPGYGEYHVYDADGDCVQGPVAEGCPGYDPWTRYGLETPGKAIENCPADGSVVFGAGVFTDMAGSWGSYPLYSWGAVEIRGAGIAATRLAAPAGSYIYAYPADRPITVKDIILEGLHLEVRYRLGVTVENVRFRYGDYGIRLWHPGWTSPNSIEGDVNITNCYLHDIKSNAIGLEDIYASEGPVTISNTITQNVPTAYDHHGWSPFAAIELWGVHDVRIIDTDILDSASVGVNATGAGVVMMDGGSVVNADGAGAYSAILAYTGSDEDMYINGVHVNRTRRGYGVGNRGGNGDLSVTNSVIRNSAYMGVVSAWGGNGAMEVVNNTMYGNAGGFDVYLYGSGTKVVANNIHQAPLQVPNASFSSNMLWADAGLSGDLVPTFGVGAHNAGDMAFAGVAGATDFGGDARVVGCPPATIDVGANELQDLPAVVAVCQNATVSLDASGNASITSADVDDVSDGGCGTLSLSVAPSAFTCADIGDNTVTLTVTDEAAQTATCEAIVTVVDDTPPVWNPLACGYSPGQNPGGSINPNYRSGFHTVMAVDAIDNCGAVYYEADIDGVPVEIGDMVHVTIAHGQTAGKITNVHNVGTVDEVTFIVGPNGLLSARVKDGSGNYLLDPNALPLPADQRLYCREVARKPY